MTKTKAPLYSDEYFEELKYTGEYADFIMNSGKTDRVIYNADSLLEAMEANYLFEEFLETLGE